VHTDGYKPKMSIIVPVHNEASKTVRCFASIRANTVIPYELIWVDNGSTEHNRNIIKRQATKPNVHTKLVKFKKNTGFVKAINAGITEAESSSRYIILLNNDTEVTYGWDNGLTTPLDDLSVGAVGPITQSIISWQEPENLNRRWNLKLPLYPRGQGTNKAVDYYIKSLAAYQRKEEYVDVTPLPLSFFCVAFRKDIFDKIGKLDEDFGVGLGDDDEFCFRLRANKYRCLLHLKTFVYHWHRTTFTTLKLPVDSIRRTNVKTLKRKKKAYEIHVGDPIT
jgi:GT2 family glycosyltransferase